MSAEKPKSAAQYLAGPRFLIAWALYHFAFGILALMMGAIYTAFLTALDVGLMLMASGVALPLLIGSLWLIAKHEARLVQNWLQQDMTGWEKTTLRGWLVSIPAASVAGLVLYVLSKSLTVSNGIEAVVLAGVSALVVPALLLIPPVVRQWHWLRSRVQNAWLWPVALLVPVVLPVGTGAIAALLALRSASDGIVLLTMSAGLASLVLPGIAMRRLWMRSKNPQRRYQAPPARLIGRIGFIFRWILAQPVAWCASLVMLLVTTFVMALIPISPMLLASLQLAAVLTTSGVVLAGMQARLMSRRTGRDTTGWAAASQKGWLISLFALMLPSSILFSLLDFDSILLPYFPHPARLLLLMFFTTLPLLWLVPPAITQWGWLRQRTRMAWLWPVTILSAPLVLVMLINTLWLLVWNLESYPGSIVADNTVILLGVMILLHFVAPAPVMEYLLAPRLQKASDARLEEIEADDSARLARLEAENTAPDQDAAAHNATLQVLRP